LVARYRSHVGAPRARQLRLRLTDDEMTLLAEAAERAGLTPSGYAAEAAISAARGVEAPSLLPWREVTTQLILARGQLRRIGTNLNQATKALNVEGEVPVWMERVCQIVERSVRHIDEATESTRRLARRQPSPMRAQTSGAQGAPRPR
jgi:uncharacterized protein (DUF1778 family)